MSDGNGRILAALGGLVAVVGSAAVIATVWYALPEEPRIASRVASEAPDADYEAAERGCAPAQLQALAPANAPRERARCAEAREQHRIYQQNIAESVRANDVAEGNLWVAAEATRIAFAQTLATVAAFIAAAAAALIALRAVHWARKASEHTEAGAKAANAQLEAIKVAERAYLTTPAQMEGEFDGLTLVAINPGRTHAHVTAMWWTACTTLPKRPSLRGVLLVRAECDVHVMGGQKEILDNTGPIPDEMPHVVGYIEFTDVYRAKRRQHFRFDRCGKLWIVAGGPSWNAAK